MFSEAKILDIDLSKNQITTRTLDGETYRKYPGGSALGMYFLLKEMDPKADPLSPENLLIFSVSPLTGLPISGQSRMCVTTKSPLTGTAGDSQVGGYIPAHLKASGYDAVIFRGKAETPVYLYIDGDQVELRDAKPMWGKITGDTEDLIREDLGEKNLHMSVIGPAGENQVLFSNIMHFLSRANGRNGVGAVMGSKNLKAFVVKRQKTPMAQDMTLLKTLTGNVKQRIEENAVVKDTGINGSAGVTDFHNPEGFMPTRNWSEGQMENCEPIYGETITNTVLKKRETCHACAIRCKPEVEIEGKVDAKYGGPEYETVGTFGTYCGVNQLEDICVANQLCNMYGLDTISCGATIAFAMDCYEKGLINNQDTEGLELKFGNGSVYETLIPKIAKREGFGALLALGSGRMAQKIGPEAEKLAVVCKNQELPAHMPQMKPNLGIGYAVNPFGADHQSFEHDPALMAAKDSHDWLWGKLLGDFEPCDAYGVLDANKAKYTWAVQRNYSMMDTLCLCQFAWGPAWQLYGPEELVTFCKAGIGWDTSIEELQEIGERRINMMRLFNAKAGFTKAEDTLPDKAFLPIPEGPGAGTKITREDFEVARDAYYAFAGWDKETGNPTPETLKRIGLEEFI